MQGDFSRLTFRPENRYRSVRLQQGRVLLDADWNEQMEIQDYLDDTTTRDVVGPSGAPIGQAGFALSVQGSDIRIGAGHYYVDGVLCENDSDVSLVAQADLPGLTLPSQAGTYAAYLDVWERQLTALDRPALREVALGGPDTATRAQTVWQVKLERVGDLTSTLACPSFGPDWMPPNAKSTGQLEAQPKPGDQSQGECLVPSPGGYRRLDNQLYRVEIHTAGPAGTATFVWSRDNGSVVTRLVDITGNDLTVSDVGRDAYLSFAPDQWVELSDEARVLRGEAGVLVQLDEVQGNVLTVKSWPGNTPLTMASFGSQPTVRRWDSPGEVSTSTAGFLDLGDDGIQVAFAVGDYRVGDYWTIPARTQTLDNLSDTNVIGGVDWPRDTTGPLFQPRQGPRHHYAVLGLLQLAGTTWTVESDCRRVFPPATELVSLSYVGGDGQETIPGSPLPQPLQVGVFNGTWPVAGAIVQFSAPGAGKVAANAAGLGTAGNALPVTTGADGIASCAWQPDPTVNSQQLTATLTTAVGNPIRTPALIRFTANLSVARQVAYDPSGCATLAGVTNVQDALTTLCQNLGGSEPGILIKEVQLLQPNQPLRNDTNVPPAALAGGLRVVLDQPVDPLAIRAKPVGDVTLELPFPILPQERDFWNAPGIVGFQPLNLAGEFVAEGPTIVWKPSGPTHSWLTDGLVKGLLQAQQTAPLLVHFLLKGNFIWAQDKPDLYLDGEAFGVRASSGGTIDVRFTGDGRRGGNLDMWFWLQIQAPPPAVTPQSLAITPPIVVPGAAAAGVVTLTGPAPAGGVTVALASSDPSIATVPASVQVAAGQNTANFQVRAMPTTIPVPRVATISATLGGVTQSAQLTVRLG